MANATKDPQSSTTYGTSHMIFTQDFEHLSVHLIANIKSSVHECESDLAMASIR